jgi:hypothetical protein
MPIRVSTSDSHGLVQVVFEGIVDVERDFGEAFASLVKSPEIARLPLLLVDTTSTTRIEGPSESVAAYARRIGEEVDDVAAAGARVAVIAVSDEFFGLARMYEMHREPTTVNIQVFREKAKATSWLGLPDGYEADLRDLK